MNKYNPTRPSSKARYLFRYTTGLQGNQNIAQRDVGEVIKTSKDDVSYVVGLNGAIRRR